MINEILKKVTTYCENQWLVIQRRQNGFETSFNKTWHEYSTGFGSLRGDFWIGLETISKLTKQRAYELVIELTDWSDQFFIAKYDHFEVSDEEDFYRLSISGSFKGNASKGFSKTNHF
jgi:ficolin